MVDGWKNNNLILIVCDWSFYSYCIDERETKMRVDKRDNKKWINGTSASQFQTNRILNSHREQVKCSFCWAKRRRRRYLWACNHYICSVGRVNLVACSNANEKWWERNVLGGFFCAVVDASIAHKYVSFDNSHSYACSLSFRTLCTHDVVYVCSLFFAMFVITHGIGTRIRKSCIFYWAHKIEMIPVISTSLNWCDGMECIWVDTSFAPL